MQKISLHAHILHIYQNIVLAVFKFIILNHTVTDIAIICVVFFTYFFTCCQISQELSLR